MLALPPPSSASPPSPGRAGTGSPRRGVTGSPHHARRRLSASLLAAALGAVACGGTLTREEAGEAVEEVKISTQALALTSGTVEIKTDFTIGEAVEQAAEEIRAFYVSQLPCAEVSRAGATLTVDYGVNGECLYRGQRFSGSHSLTVSANAEAEVIVDHVWNGLENDTVRVDGTATVTWSLADRSRHVQHELRWTRLSDGRTGVGRGDRIQTALDEGIGVGLREDGTRSWEGKKGLWELAIDGVEVRWVDPVPQAGTLTLDTPFDKTLTMSFQRVGPARIKVTVAGPRRSFDFDVVTLSAQ